MKKKVSKLLFLVAVVATLGAVVSCKDTNEDYITQITQQIKQEIVSSDQQAIDALQAQIDNANAQLAEYKALLDEYRALCVENSCKCTGEGGCSCNPGKECTCDMEGITNQINSLQGSINTLTITIESLENQMSKLDEKADAAELAALQQTVNALNDMILAYSTQLSTLQNNYDNLAAEAANDRTIIAGLEEAVKTLQEALAKIKQCNCDGSGNCNCDGSGNCNCDGSGSCNCTQKDLTDILDRLSALEEAMIVAKADAAQAAKDAKDALEKANTAIETANGAQETATAAQAAALTAQNSANAAQAAADAAAAAAQSAQTAADEAKGDAAAAKKLAEDVKKLAEDAQKAADDAQKTADDALAKASQNEEDIKKLLERVGTAEGKIEEIEKTVTAQGQTLLDHTSRIESLETQVISLKEEVAKAIADAAAAAAAAKANSDRIEALETLTGEMGTQIKGLQTSLEGLKDALDDLKKQVEKNKEDIATNAGNIATNKKAIEDILSKVTAMDTRVGTLETMAEDFEKRISDLEKQVKDIKEDIVKVRAEADAKLAEAKAYADAEIEKVKIDLQAQITVLQNGVTDLFIALFGEEELGEKNIAEQIACIIQKLAEMEAAGSCTCDINDIATKVDDILKLTEQFTTINGKLGEIDVINGKIVDINNNIATITGEINGKITTIETNVSNLTDKVTGLDTRIGDLEKEVATIKALLEGRLDALEELVKSFATKEELENLGTEVKELIEEVREEIDTAKQELQEKIDDVQEELQGQIDQITTKLDELVTKDEELEESISQLAAKIADDIVNAASACNDYTDEQIAALRNELTTVIENKIKDLQDQLEDLKKRVEENEKNIAQNKKDIESNLARIIALEAEDVVIKKLIEDNYNALDARISANETKLSELEEAYKKADEELAGDIANLRKDLTDLEERVAANEKSIDQLTQDVAKLQEILAKQVTGIILEGSDNPVFGSVTTPFGTQSNMLIGLYGKLNHDVDFPTARTSNNVKASGTLTERDMQMLGDVQKHYASGSYLVENEDGTASAGTLFMTVNPAQVDHTGLNLSIVNSQDEDSHVSLGALKPSDRVLRFGFTRAGKNGFYEAPAYIKTEDLDKVQRVNFNVGTVKETFQELANNRRDANLTKVANNVYDIVKGLQIDRNAVKCEWNTGTDSLHTVSSGYDLAATAVEPLGLNFGEDFDFKTIPGFERANTLLDDLSKTVNDMVHSVFGKFGDSELANKLRNLTIKEIKIADLSEDQLALFSVSIDTTIFFGGMEYHLELEQDVDVPVKFEKDLEIPVDLTTTVTVPVNVDADVEIDLSNVTVSSPTVVVHGTATGTGSTTDKDGNLSTDLIVPVTDNDGNIVGYTTIPLNQITVNADIDATGGLEEGTTISLDGTPIAKVHIEKDIDAEVEIHDKVTYHLVIDETVKTTVKVDKWVRFGDYRLRKDENGNVVYGSDGNPIYDYVGEGNGDTRSIHIWVNRDMKEAAESLWGTAQDALGSVNDMLDDIRDIVDEVNNLLDDINKFEKDITDKVDNYLDKIKNYLDRINKKVVDIVNGANNYIQPLMLVSTSEGTKRLSGTKNYPTIVEAGNLTLTPTTKCMELLVPICKKHVAVTNVFKGSVSAQSGDADCLARLKAVNNAGEMNQVFGGSERVVNGYNFKAGYTYEIAYSCLDFLGNISVRKYYVSCK